MDWAETTEPTKSNATGAAMVRDQPRVCFDFEVGVDGELSREHRNHLRICKRIHTWMQQLVLKFQDDFWATLLFVSVCANCFEVSLYVNLLRSVRDASVVPFNQYESMQIHVSSETTNSNVSIVTSMTLVCECR